MTAINKDALKALAKETGRTLRDLLVLSPNKDPFNVGSPTQRRRAEWFAEMCDRNGQAKTHLRRLHYWLLSQGATTDEGMPYVNTGECWQALLDGAQFARYLGLVPEDVIEDRRNPDPIIHRRDAEYEATPDLADIARQLATNAIPCGRHFGQPYLLEVWVEKSTMNDVLIPILGDHGVNLVTALGEQSVTAAWAFVQRVRASGRPGRIFYVSDFDPAGVSIPCSLARKVEFYVHRYREEGEDLDVAIRQLALTGEQVRDFDLPGIPVKDVNRGDAFKRRQGVEEAVELDALEALHPGALEDMVRQAVEPYIDHEIRHAVSEAIQASYDAAWEALAPMFRKIGSAIEQARQPVELPAALPVNEDLDAYLFHAARGYLTQLERYRAHKGQEDAR